MYAACQALLTPPMGLHEVADVLHVGSVCRLSQSLQVKDRILHFVSFVTGPMFSSVISPDSLTMAPHRWIIFFRLPLHPSVRFAPKL